MYVSASSVYITAEVDELCEFMKAGPADVGFIFYKLGKTCVLACEPKVREKCITCFYPYLAQAPVRVGTQSKCVADSVLRTKMMGLKMVLPLLIQKIRRASKKMDEFSAKQLMNA